MMQDQFLTAPAPDLRSRILLQIEEVKAKLHRVNLGMLDKTDNPLENTVLVIRTEAESAYWEQRLRDLTQAMQEAELSANMHSAAIEVGDLVQLQKSEQSDGEWFRLTDKVALYPGERCISLQSPLGKLLLGKVAGDVVSVDTPVGCKSYTVRDWIRQ